MTVFQKRHYTAIALMLAKLDVENLTKKDIVEKMCEYFKADNNKFDETKFRYAIKAFALDYIL